MRTIITIILALVAMTGLAQTKTATVIGYSPALKDGTLVFAGTGSTSTVVDTVQAGRFAYTLPVVEFTESFLSFLGEGCTRSHTLIFLRPGVTVKVTGNDCLNLLWKVESPIPEQQIQNRLTEYCRDVLTESLQMDFFRQDTEKMELRSVIAEHLLSQARACYLDLHRATARERYELLLQRCPGIVEHLDLQDIASFLNVTPKTISMIRKDITFGKD